MKGSTLTRLLVFLGILFLVGSCGTTKHSTETYQAYSDSVKDTGSMSYLLMTDGRDTRDYVDWININNNLVKHKNYGVIAIEPGLYTISWGRKFNISPFIKASGSARGAWSAELELKAGHKYVFHARRTIGHGYVLYSWIRNDTVNEEVWDSRSQ